MKFKFFIMEKLRFPEEISAVIQIFKKNGYKAYAVGGCVRDVLRKAEPKDWDIASLAKPEEIQKIFPDSFYANKFGTVTVKTKSENPALAFVEITTFRKESGYADKRHPDAVEFVDNIEEDLARRDFTVNAVAADGEKIIDPFGGQNDLKKRIIKAVGEPEERFNEDALRMMRAVRLACELGFSARGGPSSGWEIEEKTLKAIKKEAGLLRAIAKERIRDEFAKIISSPRGDFGVDLLREVNLLKYIIPELDASRGVGQNKHHIYDVYEHSLKSLAYAVKQNYDFDVRLAALLHDIGKPPTKRGEGLNCTFYGHEVVGARTAAKMLSRLHFSKQQIEIISLLVRYHLFYYNVGEVTESSVRRLVRNVGPENISDLLNVRKCDRIGSGVPKAEPYKLRHLRYLIEKVSRDPISAKMLAVKGDDVMKILNVRPGPKIGWILDILLDEVLEEPEKNGKEYLEKRIAELGATKEAELEQAAANAKKKRGEVQMKIETVEKKKYWVT